ncbi:MAG: hypothetical protein NW200_07625 [Hyphomonadaceae bacterium]|nr:hypothetical protein [Hyphomonadaceae bacterium]
MPRPAGRRNPDYAEKRARLVQELCDYVLRMPPTRPSLRQMAQVCAVSEPTLRHYFGDREDVAIAIIEELGVRARPIIDAVETETASAAQAVESYIELSLIGVRNGAFARAHCFGIVEGVADPRVGRAYLTALLEPSLAALDRRMAPHVGGAARQPMARAAALQLFAPLLLTVIHQQLLGGEDAAPMDVDDVFRSLGRLLGGRVQA